MGLWFRTFEHLLPRGRVWQMKLPGQLRDFFMGLTTLPADVRDFVDAVWFDMDPQTTRELDQWEDQWGLRVTGLTDQGRRDRLEAQWAALGGQSPRYLQDTMQANGFDVYIHDWWAVPAAAPPVPRNPNLVLTDGGITYAVCCGDTVMECGEADAVCGDSSTPTGYPLVNKIPLIFTIPPGCGDTAMECGEDIALLGEDYGGGIGNVSYSLPSDPLLYPYFVYFGGATYPDHAVVDSARRNEFEELLLTICPGHLWIGVLVDYA